MGVITLQSPIANLPSPINTSLYFPILSPVSIIPPMIENKAVDKLRTLVASDNPIMALLGVLIVVLAAGAMVGILFGGLGPIFAIGVLGVLLAAYLMLRSTQWGFVALLGLIILLPYAAFPFKIGFTPTFLDAILLALYGVWFLRVATGTETTFTASPLGVPIFAFLAWAVVAFIAGLAHTSLSPTILRNFAEVLLAVMLFFAVVNQVKTVAQLEQLSQVILISGGIMSALGIIFYFIPGNWTIAVLSKLRVFGYPTDGILRYIEDNPENPMRAIATSIDPNALGGLLVILTVIAVAFLFAKKPVLPRRYLLLITGMMGILLYLTYSRGSLLGVVAALGVMSLLRYRKLLLWMLIGAALMLILPQTQLYVSRFLEGIQGADLATQMRFGEYKDALTLISRYPLMGVGFSGTPDIDLYLGVSSLYLLIAEEMGAVGLSLYLLISAVFFTVVYRTWKRLPAGHRLEAPLMGYSLAVLGAMVSGIFDHFFFNITFTHLVALYWLSMGLAMAAVLRAREELEAADD